MNVATFDGVDQGAAGFLTMAAVAESAVAEKRAEFDEALGQFALVEMPEAEFPDAGRVDQVASSCSVGRRLQW